MRSSWTVRQIARAIITADPHPTPACTCTNRDVHVCVAMSDYPQVKVGKQGLNRILLRATEITLGTKLNGGLMVFLSYRSFP